MKISRFQMHQQILWVVTVLILTHCVGCLNVIDKILDNADEPSNGDSDNDSWIITDMPVRDVVVLIAGSLPVQVSVKRSSGTCQTVVPHAMKHINRGQETPSPYR